MKFDVAAYLKKFDPKRDKAGWVIEPLVDYVARIQGAELPNWPEEVLIEWLYRHNTGADRYAFLGFENFNFQLRAWTLEEIPDRSAFWDPKFCDNFENIETRAHQAHDDWLAKYMIENETWNTAPIFLENENREIKFPSGEHFKSPYHLLEGHRRVSFLNGLRKMGKGKPTHNVWIAKHPYGKKA